MIDYLISLGPFQWVGLLCGVVYVFLAARSNPYCWYFGILSCSAIAIEDFTHTRLYSDGWLQIFYVGLSIYGIYEWRAGKDKKVKPVIRKSLHEHFKYIVIAIILAIPIGTFFQYFSNANFPFVDATTTGFSIVASYLLVKRVVGNWIYWILIDTIYIYLYWDTSAPLFSILFFIYIFMSFYGLYGWKKELETQIN